MSVIIPYTVETSGEQCPICLEEFSIKEQRYSHEGGEQHGSHKQCLADWVINHPDCPVERTPLDATSILTMKDFALHRMEPAFYNATIATIIGLAATCTLGFGWAIAAKFVRRIWTRGRSLGNISGSHNRNQRRSPNFRHFGDERIEQTKYCRRSGVWRIERPTLRSCYDSRNRSYRNSRYSNCLNLRPNG